MAMDSRPKQHTAHYRQSPTTMPDAAPPPYENIVAFDTRSAEKADPYSVLWTYCSTFCPRPLVAVAGKVSNYVMKCNEESKPELKETTSLTVDSQMIQQTIALLQVIADMQAKENGVLQQQSTILDLYLLALERFFSALSRKLCRSA